MSQGSNGAGRARGCAVLVSRIAALVIPGIICTAAVPTIGRPLVRDVRQYSFPTVEGTVTASDWRPEPRWGYFDWKLTYTYVVDGRTYTGSRYDYAEDRPGLYSPADRDRMLAVVPSGGTVTVAYDPDDPADAALRPVRPGRLFEQAVLLLGVCGLTALYFWIGLFNPRAGGDRPGPRHLDLGDPRQVAPVRGGILLRLPTVELIHPGLVFLGTGLLIILITRVRPTPPDPYPWWAGFLNVVVAPAGVVLLAVLRRSPGLFVDPERRVLTFDPGRPWSRLEVPFDAITDIGVVPRTQSAKGGHLVFQQVMLAYTATGRTRSAVLCEYLNPADAEVLAVWLRVRTTTAAGSLNGNDIHS